MLGVGLLLAHGMWIAQVTNAGLDLERGCNILGSWSAQPRSNLLSRRSTLKTEDELARHQRNDWAALGGELILSPLPHTHIDPEDLPPEFTWADKEGRNYLTLTRNQNLPQFCESSWAHATTSALADRVQIFQNASQPPMGPAPQVLLNCYTGGDCSGGDPGGIYVYAKDQGIPDDTVQSYQAVEKQCKPHGRAEWCDYIVSPGDGCKPLGHHDQPPNMTLPPTPYPLYSVTEYGGVKGVHQMKAEIFARGPISCGIVASTHFVNYTGGILQIEFSPGAQLKHEVSVVGWGVHEDKGVSSAMKPEMYWVVRNSYGSHWGELGYARISAVRNGGLDSDCSWGVPTVRMPPATTGSNNGAVARVAKRGRLSKRKHPRRLDDIFSPLPQDYVRDDELPESYDTRSLLGRDYTTVSRSQNIPHACGSCWIQATVSAVSDRIKLMRRASFPDVVLSTQVALDCANQNASTPNNPPDESFTDDNCVGGHPDDVMALLMKEGLPDDTCQSYQGVKQDCSPANVCRTCPHDGCMAVKPRRYRIREHGEVLGELNMTKEIFARGPIAATIAVTDALEEYRGSRTPASLRTVVPGTAVFNDSTGAVTEDHVVELTGWGAEKGVKYWVVRNSWGTWWGDGGWAKIIRGTNNLGIESQDVYWAVPDDRDFP